MCRNLLLCCVAIASISIVSSYVPVKGGRHSPNLKEESTIKVQHEHDEVKHDQVTYPILIENHDFTPKIADKDIISQGESEKHDDFISILEDVNKSATEEHNHKSTTHNDKKQQEIEINQSKSDSSTSHAEDHHMKNEHEEKHVHKEVKQNFHHDEQQTVFKSGSSLDHNLKKNHAEDEHKVLFKEDQHKVSMSGLDGKNVEHKQNTHSLHVSNKDNPSTYHIEQHTSFDGVKIDNQDKASRDHHSSKIDIDVPVGATTFDAQHKVDLGQKDISTNFGSSLFEETVGQGKLGDYFEVKGAGFEGSVFDNADKQHEVKATIEDNHHIGKATETKYHDKDHSVVKGHSFDSIVGARIPDHVDKNLDTHKTHHEEKLHHHSDAGITSDSINKHVAGHHEDTDFHKIDSKQHTDHSGESTGFGHHIVISEDKHIHANKDFLDKDFDNKNTKHFDIPKGESHGSHHPLGSGGIVPHKPEFHHYDHHPHGSSHHFDHHHQHHHDHHHPMFKHNHHFDKSHESGDSSEECGDSHPKVHHHPHFPPHHSYHHHHHSPHHYDHHDHSDFHHTKGGYKH